MNSLNQKKSCCCLCWTSQSQNASAAALGAGAGPPQDQSMDKEIAKTVALLKQHEDRITYQGGYGSIDKSKDYKNNNHLTSFFNVQTNNNQYFQKFYQDHKKSLH